MPQGKLFPLTTQPGIKRDGTNFAGRYYTDGQWCRFQRGLPRKMGGYRQIIGELPTLSRGMYVTPVVTNFGVYAGTYNSLGTLMINQEGQAISGMNDRTPVDLAPDGDNLWQFDQMFSTVDNTSVIIAHAAPNLSCISNTEERPVFKGNVNDNSPFVSIGQSTSGGLVVLHPYLVLFGNDGYVRWSAANDPTNFPADNVARVTSQKIVAGMATRGGTASPAGLLWSLNSLIRMTFNPDSEDSPNWRFDTVSDQSSILSSKSVIEYDGLYFWAGIDRFLVYNGVVQEVPNQMNQNYFYYNNPNNNTGLNYPYRQKVWATKVPQYGEVWWHFPSGNNTECDRAVIYNKRENTWYDTMIGRSSGYFEQVFADPIWADTLTPGAIWQHESGIDQNINGALTAIPSSFETGDIAWSASGPSGSWTGVDRWVDLYRVEPDFIQVGDMDLSIRGRKYARSPSVQTDPYTFTPDTTKIDMREQRREMRLRFNSNTIGGFYELGQTLLNFRTGDERP